MCQINTLKVSVATALKQANGYFCQRQYVCFQATVPFDLYMYNETNANNSSVRTIPGQLYAL